MKRNLQLFVFFILTATYAYTQTHTGKTLNVNGNCKGYYEYLPVNYASSDNKFPLLIYCGGAGTFGNGSSNLSRLLTEGPAYFIRNNQFPSSFNVNGEASSYIIISPQFVNWPEPNDVEALINYVLAQGYKVDQSRIYLAGFSAGGDVTWMYPNTSVARSKRLAAIVPVAAYNYPYVDTGAKHIAAANLPVWALHSNADQTAPASWSQNFVNKINSYNPPTPAKITRVNGVAHDPSKNYFFNPTYESGGYSIYEWLLTNRRNYPPVANAGNDVSITLPNNSVNLSGSSTYDPENDPLTYQWKKISGPSAYTINNASSISINVSGLVAGVYEFELTATDNNALFDKDIVKVTVINPGSNSLPNANAGNDIQISLPQNSVTLNGSASSDAGGSIENYLWQQVSGPTTVNPANPSSVTTSLSNLKKGTYSYQLTITDNEGGIDKDTIVITVINPYPNVAPVANAGSDQSITLPVNSISVSGSASSDVDGFITQYLWSQVSGPAQANITNSTSSNTSITGLVAGLYQFRLSVTDDSSAVSTDVMEVTVLPPPTVTSKHVRVNLFGGSNAYNTDGWNNWNVTGSNNISSTNFKYSDGSNSGVNAVLSYSQGIGDNGSSYGGTMCPPQVLRYTTYSTAQSRSLTIRGLDNSLKYDLEFYASRSTSGNTTSFVINGVNKSVSTDNNKTQKVVFIDVVPVNGQIVVSVNKSGTYSYLNGFLLIEKSLTQSGLPPVANAGDDITIQLPNSSVNLNGTNSYDPDGAISSYLWTKISGPSSYSFNSNTSSTPTVTGLTAGTYQFELKVTDNTGDTDLDTVIVNVNQGPQAPVARAGNDVLIHLPVNTVQLNGNTSFDADGNITAYQWSKISGPASFTLNSSSVVNPTIGNLVAGVYSIELVVTDNQGLAGKDTVVVTVNAVPQAAAGNDVVIDLPQNSVQLNGNGSTDVDGNIQSYLWSKISGPGQFSINNANIVNPVVSGLTQGTYKIELIITDNRGATGKDTITITVNQGPQPPIANAGTDKTIHLPANSIQLDGSGSYDLDGSIAGILWNKVSGPASYTINANDIINPVLSNLTAGVYIIELVVTDNEGYAGKDTMAVRLNQLPVANAGNDQSIVLPANSVQLTGSGSNDADGSIASYSWQKMSGPASFNFSNASVANPLVSNLTAGIYVFRLNITDNSGGVSQDQVTITVYPQPNQPPVANAGNDQTITIPQTAVVVNGSSSSDADGIITTYSWLQIAGPTSADIANASVAQTNISGLSVGLYSFVLSVADDSSAVSKDTIDITVLPPPAETIKYVRVNLFGGSNPYNQDGWNNWNVSGSTNITSSNFNYSDGSSSMVNAVLGYSQGVPDNGASYGGTVCPPQVLRYTSYSTAHTRSLVIRGLNNSLKYDLEFYSSRASTGNSTTFVINGISRTVVSDNNKTDKAVFEDIVPVNGQISIAINKIGTFTYINGFILTEKTLNQSGGYAPFAAAGTDKEMQLPQNSINLDGSSSTDVDGSIVSYSWTRISGPVAYNITNANAAVTTLSNLVAGNYKFELAVTDNEGLTGKDTIDVRVLDIIIPGTTDSFNCNKPFTIVVIGSSSAYGTGASPLDSSWVNKYSNYAQEKNIQTQIINLGIPSVTTYQILRPNGYVPPADRPAPDVNRNITKALSYQPDVIIINLPSNDVAMGYSQTETIANYERTMQLADSANVPVWVTTTQPRNGLSPNEKSLQMHFRDWTMQRFGEKAIDFWTDVADSAGFINELYSTGDGVHVNNAGHHLFYTRVVAERILDSLCLRNNILPVANAGNDINVILPQNHAQLNGSASTDEDGSLVSYAWSYINGPASYTFDNATSVMPVVSGMTEGVYRFLLTVTDNLGSEGKDTVIVTVNPQGPQPPVAVAGTDVVIHLPNNSTQLNGGNSFDWDGNINSYTWNKLTGPSTFSINNNSIVNPVISNLSAGKYLIELVVVDDDGMDHKDTIAVLVNMPPTAHAGNDRSIVYPTNSLLLSGSGSTDTDGSIVSYYWERMSGPLAYSLSDANASNTQLSNLNIGDYVFRLTVVDNNGGVSYDDINITVYPPPNVAPVARAGNDQTITLPVNSVVVNASGSSDADGIIVGYSWTQVSGPSTAGFTDPTSINTTINGLQEGVYRFNLKVTDDSSATSSDIIEISVLAEPVVTSKFIKVNLFGGSNPYNQDGWNNWNVSGSTNITSSNFNYSDGSSSTVSAVLGYSQGVPDNGSTYGGTVCPPQVLRYTSYSTAHTRSLVIRGLNNALRYDIEFYASRYTTGNSTTFVINGTSVTVNTDNNKDEKAAFQNIAPVNGQISIAINKVGTFSYLNGFILTENANNGQQVQSTYVDAGETQDERTLSVKLFPNPFSSSIQMNLKTEETGKVRVRITDANGVLVKQIDLEKSSLHFSETIHAEGLPTGVYFIRVDLNSKVYVSRIIKVR